MVRTLARKALESHGYRVLEAGAAAAALELSERHVGPINVLLTDVVMPGMSGRELAHRLLQGRGTLRVLYMSGYTDDAVLRHGVLEEGMAYLQKPFTPDQLARKVREVLEESPDQNQRRGEWGGGLCGAARSAVLHRHVP